MQKSTKFLLVDDDIDDSALFKNILHEASPSVSLQNAYNGKEALDILRSEEILPDAIFLDLNMPLMDGKECLAEIKSDDELKDIPVIMYTTSSHSKDIEDTMLKGAVCFITKPSNVNELKYILSHISTHVHDNLQKALQTLSDTASTFIVC